MWDKLLFSWILIDYFDGNNFVQYVANDPYIFVQNRCNRAKFECEFQTHGPIFLYSNTKMCMINVLLIYSFHIQSTTVGRLCTRGWPIVYGNWVFHTMSQWYSFALCLCTSSPIRRMLNLPLKCCCSFSSETYQSARENLTLLSYPSKTIFFITHILSLSQNLQQN